MLKQPRVIKNKKCVGKQRFCRNLEISGARAHIHSTEKNPLYLQQLQIQASYYAMCHKILTVF